MIVLIAFPVGDGGVQDRRVALHDGSSVDDYMAVV
jgi:hypothetical protein